MRHLAAGVQVTHASAQRSVPLTVRLKSPSPNLPFISLEKA